MQNVGVRCGKRIPQPLHLLKCGQIEGVRCTPAEPLIHRRFRVRLVEPLNPLTGSAQPRDIQDCRISFTHRDTFLRTWSAAIPSGQWRYYDGTLYTLALLQVSGGFRLWY